jgi:hypothetical protein
MTVSQEKSKNWKYILTKPRANLKLPAYRKNPSYTRESGMTRVVDLSTDTLPGTSCSIGTVWMWPGERPKPAGKGGGVEPHTHEFDEILGFFGTNPDDQYDLGGEVELWLEDEPFVLTKSFMAFIPAGMKHCPLIMRRIDRPIFHFGVVPKGVQYI